MTNQTSEPKILAVDKVDLFNPSTESDETLKRIDFQGFDGSNILDHDVVERRINDGWIPRGLEAKVNYKNVTYKVRVAGNNKMGYVKTEDIGDVSKARELQKKVREKFLEHFRLNR